MIGLMLSRTAVISSSTPRTRSVVAASSSPRLLRLLCTASSRWTIAHVPEVVRCGGAAETGGAAVGVRNSGTAAWSASIWCSRSSSEPERDDSSSRSWVRNARRARSSSSRLFAATDARSSAGRCPGAASRSRARRLATSCSSCRTVASSFTRLSPRRPSALAGAPVSRPSSAACARAASNARPRRRTAVCSSVLAKTPVPSMDRMTIRPWRYQAIARFSDASTCSGERGEPRLAVDRASDAALGFSSSARAPDSAIVPTVAPRAISATNSRPDVVRVDSISLQLTTSIGAGATDRWFGSPAGSALSAWHRDRSAPPRRGSRASHRGPYLSVDMRTVLRHREGPAEPDRRARPDDGPPHRHAEALHVEIDDRRRVEREQLAQQEATDDRDAERATELGARARPEGQRQRAEERGHRRHEDRPEPLQARPMNGLLRGEAVVALEVERDVDHHDGILLHDPDEQDDPDHRDDREIHAAEKQGQKRADAGRRQRGEDRERVDQAFVEDAQDDVDRDQRRQDEQRLVGERGLE